MSLPMRRILANSAPWLLLLALAGGGQAAERGGSSAVSGKERALQAKIVLLQQRQQLLLFEKAFSTADSKYLMLDLRAGRGTLKYRNRVLRSFSLTLRPTGSARRIAPGPVRLSARTDGGRRSRELLFGEPAAVIVAARGGAVSAGARGVPRLLLGARDLAAVFHALEKGSYLYITPEGGPVGP